MQIASNTNDHAFEALLQSQRELLSQMKYGTATTTPVKWNNTSNHTAQATECGFEKLVFNRRSSLDRLFPSSSSGTTRHGDDDGTYKLPSLDQFDMKKTKKTKKNSRPHHPTKTNSDPKKQKAVVTPCKSSSTGLLNVDDLPIKPDLSESSERSFELDFELLDFNDASSLMDEQEQAADDVKLEKQMESTLVTEAETDDDDEDVEPLTDEDDNIVHTVYQAPVVQYDLEDAPKIVQAFRAAMERSQYTQQSIHDWDKKMGLKRSHSKTMRLSARSRKKLRALFKRDGVMA